MCYTFIMISIEDLRRFCQNDAIYITNHAMERCRERGIFVKDILNAIMTGTVIEDYPDDFPFPSCLICGQSLNDAVIHVCLSNEGESSKVITAYFPSSEKWENDLITRKEDSK